ncbi:hypothetical protein Hanom_Chr07g00641121 [Helianthus anomalus]
MADSNAVEIVLLLVCDGLGFWWRLCEACLRALRMWRTSCESFLGFYRGR